MEPASYTAESDAFQAGPSLALPFAIKLILCFLLLDAAERVYELIVILTSSSTESLGGPTPYAPSLATLFPHMVWIAINPVLAVLLYLRTSFGRIVTQVMFTLHLLAIIAPDVTITRPEIWLYVDDGARVRLLVTVIVDVAVIAYLFSAQARKALDR